MVLYDIWTFFIIFIYLKNDVKNDVDADSSENNISFSTACRNYFS